VSIRDDQLLRAHLRDAIDADPAIDAFELALDVSDGVVRLHGVVGSYAERLSAVSLIRRTDGVRGVTNDLTVRPFGADWRLTDQQVSDDVGARLRRVAGESDEVGFRVDHHVVVLTGRVSSCEARALVRHLVATTPGVDFVENEIEIGDVADRSR